MTQTPEILASALLPLRLSTELDGLYGELELIAGALNSLGHTPSVDDLMGITGSAFRTHFFRPSDNPGTVERPSKDPNMIWAPRYAWTSLRHSNYGHLESIAYFYGVDLGAVTLGKALEAWNLIRYELEEGRALLTYGMVNPGKPELIVGFRLEKNPIRQIVLVCASGHEEPVEVDIFRREIVQGEGAEYPNEITMIRPGRVASWRGSDESRLADMLRWSARHMNTSKELIYESSRFYATGLRAFEAFALFLRERVEEELAEPLVQSAEKSPSDMASFVVATAKSWAEARRAGARFMRALSQHMEDRGVTLEDLPATSADLEDLAGALEACAEVLDGIPGALGEDLAAAILDAEKRGHVAALVDKARDKEGETSKILVRLVHG